MTLATVPRQRAMSPKLSDAADTATPDLAGRHLGGRNLLNLNASVGSPWRTTRTAFKTVDLLSAGAPMHAAATVISRGAYVTGTGAPIAAAAIATRFLDERLVVELRAAMTRSPLQQPGAVGDGTQDEHHHQREPFGAKGIRENAGPASSSTQTPRCRRCAQAPAVAPRCTVPCPRRSARR